METRKLEYEIEDIEVTFSDLERFKLFDDRRHIRATQVERILVVLRSGKHFETPLVVNKKDDIYKIIDGNHRFEAMRIFLSENRDIQLTLRMAVYHNLSPEEERAIYTKWSLGIKQTIDDLLNLRKDEIPIYNILLKKAFPLVIYKSASSNSVQFSMVLKMLYCSYNAENIFQSSTPSRNSLVNVAKEYDEDHADMIINFFTIFKEALGGFRDNQFLRSTFCIPAFNIFILNSWYGKKDLVERFSRCLNDTVTSQRLREHSREAYELMRERIFQLGDRHNKKKLSRGIKRHKEDSEN